MIGSHFTKMSGAGNDFLVFAADGSEVTKADQERLSQLCRRRVSVGADGALFVNRTEGGRIRVDYFNADGGRASFCANGTRCAAAFAHRHGLYGGDEATLLTGWGEIRARVDEASHEVTLSLPDVAAPGSSIAISIAGLPPRAVPLSVGVPHLIVVTRDLESLDLSKVGPPLRNEPSLPEGANVHFVKAIDRHHLKIRSYERGVEGETLACGSGVVAAAVVTAAQQLVSPPVKCETQSGAVLTVDFERTEAGARNVRLTGDARFIYEADLGPDAERP